jgi:hypothetical protein
MGHSFWVWSPVQQGTEQVKFLYTQSWCCRGGEGQRPLKQVHMGWLVQQVLRIQTKPGRDREPRMGWKLSWGSREDSSVRTMPSKDLSQMGSEQRVLHREASRLGNGRVKTQAAGAHLCLWITAQVQKQEGMRLRGRMQEGGGEQNCTGE